MLTVDTTVVVRLVTDDDPKQTKRAAALFSTRKVAIPLLGGVMVRKLKRPFSQKHRFVWRGCSKGMY